MKTRSRLKQVIFSLLMFLVPAAAVACFQVGGEPPVLQNKDVKVRFTLNGKPISSATVNLWNHQEGIIAKSATNSNGWCVLKDISPGKYKLMFLGASETEKTAVEVSFSGDWGNQIAIIHNKSQWC